jgi:hypothetical protein
MLLYKDMVTPIQGTLAPTSASWAKKHILGFSDEEIRIDLQQQRVERAVSAELDKTAETIIKTGLFDTVDQLYGKKEGEVAPAGGEGGAPGGESPLGGDMGGPPPPAPGPEPGGGAGVTPEGFNKNDLNLILEQNLFNEDLSIDLSRGRNSLVEINHKLKDLLDK